MPPSSRAARCGSQQHACVQLTPSCTGVRALVSSAMFFASAMLKIDFNLTRGASNLLLQLPHSRTMETEADTVGMHLLAKVPAFPHLMPPPPPLLLLKLFGRLVRVFQTFQQHAKSESLLGQCVTRHTHATCKLDDSASFAAGVCRQCLFIFSLNCQKKSSSSSSTSGGSSRRSNKDQTSTTCRVRLGNGIRSGTAEG